MKTLLSFAARTQWSGILVGVIAGGIALSFASPAFMAASRGSTTLQAHPEGSSVECRFHIVRRKSIPRKKDMR